MIDYDTHRLTLDARGMSSGEAKLLEDELVLNPESVDARIKLMAFYFQRSIGNDAIHRRLCQHVFWMIEHHPDHDVFEDPVSRPSFRPWGDELFGVGARLWTEQLQKQPGNPKLASNASYYFYYLDWDRAIELLETALRLDPENRELMEKLAFTYELASPKDVEAPRMAKAFQLREELLVDVDPERRIDALADFAKVAYEVGELDKCEQAAMNVIDSCANDREGAPNLHAAYQLLGQVQSRKGKVDDAVVSLRQSGKVKCCPTLCSFGPEFDLARELLDLGKRTAVIGYLEDCSSFWESGQSELLYWWLQIKLGGSPRLCKIDAVELFMPEWLDYPASVLLRLIRQCSARHQ
jgi:tetratricopeptide (TPR) repeat protein